jgi:hypothetical protein
MSSAQLYDVISRIDVNCSKVIFPWRASYDFLMAVLLLWLPFLSWVTMKFDIETKTLLTYLKSFLFLFQVRILIDNMKPQSGNFDLLNCRRHYTASRQVDSTIIRQLPEPTIRFSLSATFRLSYRLDDFMDLPKNQYGRFGIPYTCICFLIFFFNFVLQLYFRVCDMWRIVSVNTCVLSCNSQTSSECVGWSSAS